MFVVAPVVAFFNDIFYLPIMFVLMLPVDIGLSTFYVFKGRIFCDKWVCYSESRSRMFMIYIL